MSLTSSQTKCSQDNVVKLHQGGLSYPLLWQGGSARLGSARLQGKDGDQHSCSAHNQLTGGVRCAPDLQTAFHEAEGHPDIHLGDIKCFLFRFTSSDPSRLCIHGMLLVIFHRSFGRPT